MFADWSTLVVEHVVHALRLNVSAYPDDPEIRALIEELRHTCPEFRVLWEDQVVGGLTRLAKVFVHSEVGRLAAMHTTT